MNRNDEQFLAQKIRTQYTEKKNTELDTLQKLDKKVKRPANVFAYVFGGLSAIVMGVGMSMIMTDFGSKIGVGQSFALGIIIGIIGMVMALVNFPIYRKMMSSRKKAYAPQILAVSDKIINNK